MCCAFCGARWAAFVGDGRPCAALRSPAPTPARHAATAAARSAGAGRFDFAAPCSTTTDVSMAAFVPAARAAIPTFRGVKYIDSQFADLATAQAAAAGSGVDFFVESGFLLPCLPLGCSGTPVFTWQGPFAHAVAPRSLAKTSPPRPPHRRACWRSTPSAARAAYKHVNTTFFSSSPTPPPQHFFSLSLACTSPPRLSRGAAPGPWAAP